MIDKEKKYDQRLFVHLLNLFYKMKRQKKNEKPQINELTQHIKRK